MTDQHVPPTEEEIRAHERMCCAVSPGPWRVGDVDGNTNIVSGNYEVVEVCTEYKCGVNSGADAVFIARSRDLLPIYIAEVRRLRTIVASAEQEESERLLHDDMVVASALCNKTRVDQELFVLRSRVAKLERENAAALAYFQDAEDWSMHGDKIGSDVPISEAAFTFMDRVLREKILRAKWWGEHAALAACEEKPEGTPDV